MVKNKKIIIILIIISTMILVVIYKNFINKNNFIEGEIYTNILENTEENDNGKEKSESTQKIIVYITGEINNPGIYELEEKVKSKNFMRISNSEIINFKRVKSLDMSIIGTIAIRFESGDITYASRRNIKKIKEYLKM